MLKKLRVITPLLALVGAVAYWLTPHYSEEEESYYRAVFCTIDHDDAQNFARDMENIIEGGNADYALRKNHYISALGDRMIDTWTSLSAQQQADIKEDQQKCREIMSEQQRS